MKMGYMGYGMANGKGGLENIEGKCETTWIYNDPDSNIVFKL